MAEAGGERDPADRPAQAIAAHEAPPFAQAPSHGRPFARLDRVLFPLALAVYAASLLVRLPDFPIYFFSDEAAQTVLAADLIRDGFHGGDQVFLPVYFENEFQFNLSTSVYLQVLPVLFFGKSIFVTRATAALATLIAACAVSLILRRFFQASGWWAGALVLAAMPAWFLHSRTAFEAPLFVSFFALGLYLYLRYRLVSRRSLVPMLLAFGLAFYTYRAGQIILAAAGIFLLISDWRYHFSDRRSILIGGAMLILLALPTARFQRLHPEETLFHLRLLDTYLLRDLPLSEKAGSFLANLARGLSPIYWYGPPDDLPRHVMKGYANLSLPLLPFTLIGLYETLRSIRNSASRAVLLAALAAPFGGVIAGVGITRMLAFVIPIAVLTGLGLSRTLSWSARFAGRLYPSLALFAALTGLVTMITADALRNGPTWFDDYGLSGMQYGAQQVFGAIGQEIAGRPELTVYLSPTWANGTDILKRFFLRDDSPVMLQNAQQWKERMLPLDDDRLFVLTPAEYQDLTSDPKFSEIRIERILRYPNGQPGFYFLGFSYSPEAPALFAAEEEDRKRPRHGLVNWHGMGIAIEYPMLDIGDIEQIFDGDPFTLIRTYEANPANFRLTFNPAAAFSGMRITTGSMDFRLRVQVFQNASEPIFSAEKVFRDLPDDPTVDIPFGKLLQGVSEIRFTVEKDDQADVVKIHIREVELY